MQGQLFTTDFLLRAITELPVWRDADRKGFPAFRAELARVLASRAAHSELNEAQTEDEIVKPILNALGFADAWLPQVNIGKKGREDVPDYLLFADSQRKADALTRGESERARLGLAVVEAKRWLRELDRRDEAGQSNLKPRDFGAPSSQMLRYLSRVDVASDRAVKWGMLTNGAVWRLYWQDARSRSEEFLEVNIAAALAVSGVQSEIGAPNPVHALKLFFILFNRSAFLPQQWDSGNRTLHAIALGEARGYEEKVSEKLGERVFKEVFPQLANALAKSDLQAVRDKQGLYTRAYLDEVREAALVLLYRLLFVLYAEDRRLLPAHDARYKPYSLTDLRDEIAEATDKSKVLSSRAKNYWNKLDSLFEIISLGDDQVGMPAYNGGLFERARAPLLARIGVPDSAMAAVIDSLSRRIEQIDKPRINYRDLSVAHLGGIYERLLEYSLVNEEGALAARPASFARKVSGSYYTHDDPVGLILDEAVGRLVAEKNDQFAALIASYSGSKSLHKFEWTAIDDTDPASQILELKICDPAMGSGHFLVALVDWLASRVLEAIETTEELVNAERWASHLAERGNPHVSPVVVRIAEIRKRIKAAGEKHGWALDERQLDDRHIVRRMILKRVIFGVDKNPMAVELAKVALWLHTFTVGAPLSFLDHHLKCGDSLHGEKLDSVRKGMQDLGVLFQDAELARLDLAAKSLDQVAELTDTSIAEAQESKSLADQAALQVEPIHALLSFWRALRWLVPGWPTNRLPKIKDETQRAAIAELFSGRYNLAAVAASGAVDGDTPAISALNVLLAQARALAARETFFHWWTAFPTVWRYRSEADGGFDAVIGNPPWDVLEMEDAVWFCDRDPEIYASKTTADRDVLITRLKRRSPRLWDEYQSAKNASQSALRVVRECGDFPYFSTGRINLYRLFVERCEALGNAHAVFGLLVPSGISADKAGSKYFRYIAEAKRVLAIYDFENRGNPTGSYFPDIDARTKFSAFIFGGRLRERETMSAAFYLKSPQELQRSGRKLELVAADLLCINPNTASMPMLMSQRDADITTQIYRTHPILVRRGDEGAIEAFPFRYRQGTHNMSTHSSDFVRVSTLDKDQWKRDIGGNWRSGKNCRVRLFEGKMVQMYDHRASSIKINSENARRPAQEVPTPASHKADPTFFADEQFAVDPNSFDHQSLPDTLLAFKDITSPTNIRSGIFLFLPKGAAGHTLPLMLPPARADSSWLHSAVPLVAMMNSFACDYCLRQKLQTQHLTLTVLEQLPVIAAEHFDRTMASLAKDYIPVNTPSPLPAQGTGGTTETIADFIRAEVLALTYTAHDMAPFARDMGYVDAKGDVLPPFVWDADDRAHRMARLDAIFMALYGLNEDDATYVLSTFPIVQRQDEAAYGRYRTRDLILGYIQLLAVGALKHSNSN